ncbi:DUF6350 family protein [Streptomyces polyrhachis]|uniref:DUF6350 family protein n=1 Tax=Streptomyces polyrhachis TaxID=1282885 RepID=A0ABW2GCA1_9ACTN
MSQLTDHEPRLPTDFAEPRTTVLRAPVAPAHAFAAGAVAAGLGLGFLAVLVLLLWITSPYPDSGPAGALQTVADLWLLAHGADLVRTDAAGGRGAPVGLTPLLLTAMPAYLLFRSTRDLLAPGGTVLRGGSAPLATAGWLLGGYLFMAATATAYAALGDGALRVSVLSVLLHLPPLVLLAVGAGVWAAAGTPAALLPRRPVLRPPALWLEGAGRAALAGLAILLGGGLLLTLASLVWHAAVAQDAFLHLAVDVSGRLAVLLLAVSLLPNAAVWGAAYGLGPGFSVGAGSVAGPLGAAGYPQLPVFPLLAALPPQGPGSPLTWAVAALPVAAGLGVGWTVARAAVPVRAMRDLSWTWRLTAGATALAAATAAVLLAALTWLAGGPMGRRTLAEFGPVWWQSGAAALAWTLALGVPAALAVRAWRLRGEDAEDAEEDGADHAGGDPKPGGRSRSLRAKWPLWEPRSEIIRDLEDA